MSESKDEILSALTTEHFVMQGAIGASVNEQQARASMFLYAVSGALVAIGFMAQSPQLLLVTVALLGALYLAGILTTLRLVDICMESLQAHVIVARIRKHYRALGKDAEALFDPAHGRWPEGKTDSGQIIGAILGIMTTAASMIACVNALLGAALVTLVLTNYAGLGLAVAMGVAAAFAAVQVVGFYQYQMKRMAMVGAFATSAGLRLGDEGQAAGKD